MTYNIWDRYDGSEQDPSTRLYAMFFYGSLCFYLQKYIFLKGVFVVFICTILLIAGNIESSFFYGLYALCLPYLVLYFAYIPKGYIRYFNSVGDYSYGIYIYGFSIQQMLSHFISPITPLQMLGLSTPLTFLMAYMSWHYVEKPCLKLRG